MKVELLRLDSANKPSPISEGVTEIRINSQLCKGINLTTPHTWARRAPRVATVHDVVKETIRAHLTLVHVIHVYALVDTPWVAHAQSHCTPVRYGRIASISATLDATQSGDSMFHMHQYIIKCMFIQTQPTWALINTSGGYHLGVWNFRLDHSSSFPSSILRFPLIAPPSLILNHSINYSSSQHSILELGYRKF
jgi:hypothetical protein